MLEIYYVDHPEGGKVVGKVDYNENGVRPDINLAANAMDEVAAVLYHFTETYAEKTFELDKFIDEHPEYQEKIRVMDEAINAGVAIGLIPKSMVGIGKKIVIDEMMRSSFVNVVGSIIALSMFEFVKYHQAGFYGTSKHDAVDRFMDDIDQQMRMYAKHIAGKDESSITMDEVLKTVQDISDAVHSDDPYGYQERGENNVPGRFSFGKDKRRKKDDNDA